MGWLQQLFGETADGVFDRAGVEVLRRGGKEDAPGVGPTADFREHPSHL